MRAVLPMSSDSDKSGEALGVGFIAPAHKPTVGVHIASLTPGLKFITGVWVDSSRFGDPFADDAALELIIRQADFFDREMKFTSALSSYPTTEPGTSVLLFVGLVALCAVGIIRRCVGTGVGNPESLRSSFDPAHVNTWLLRLLAQIRQVPRKDVVRLPANTFWRLRRKS
jgi:hypothetical protein